MRPSTPANGIAGFGVSIAAPCAKIAAQPRESAHKNGATIHFLIVRLQHVN